MIVISGALVLVALVLLVIGLVGQGLTFVYASIAVSLAAFVFLLLGILQRRGEPGAAPAVGAGGGPDRSRDDEGVTVVPAAATAATLAPPAEVSLAKPERGPEPERVPEPERMREPEPVAQEDPEPPVEDDGELLSDVDEAELDEIDTTVLVVPGRPRYHVDGCRYLYGKDVEEVHVLDAREEGFTPCGVCKPDAVLVADLESLPVDPVSAAAPVLAPAAVTPQSLLAPARPVQPVAGPESDRELEAPPVDEPAQDELSQHELPQDELVQEEPAPEAEPLPVAEHVEEPVADAPAEPLPVEEPVGEQVLPDEAEAVARSRPRPGAVPCGWTRSRARSRPAPAAGPRRPRAPRRRSSRTRPSASSRRPSRRRRAVPVPPRRPARSSVRPRCRPARPLRPRRGAPRPRRPRRPPRRRPRRRPGLRARPLLPPRLPCPPGAAAPSS